MIEKNFSAADYIVFVIFLSVSAFIGMFFAWKDRKKGTNQDYLTGGRKLDMFPVCMSLIASFLSSNTILGVPSEIYLYGTQYAIHLFSFTIAVILAANVFMPIYYRLNLTSVHKYLLRRFGINAIRIAGSIGFILCTLPYLGVVLYGPSLALSSVTPLKVPMSILVVGATCIFYTSIGGIKAVIWTDVVQTILMFLGLLMVAIVGSIDAGGLLAPWRIASQYDRLVIFNPTFNPYRGDTFWAVFLGTLTAWAGTYCVKQTQVQRYCCMKTPEQAKKSLYWNIPGVFLISFTAIWCGVIIFAKYHNCDPVSLKIVEKHDQLMPYIVSDLLGKYPGLPGLFVSCVFSGSLSTLSSGFNALATVTWDDLIKRYFREATEKKQLRITKFIALSYGLLAIGIAFLVGRLGTVLQASYALSGSITGPLLGLFCLGIFIPCANAIGAFVGIILGVGTCLFITFGTLVNPRPKGFQLPVSVDGCSRETVTEVGFDQWYNASQRHYTVNYWPKGMNSVYHISYMYIPVVGILTTVITGIIASLIVAKFFKNFKCVQDALSKSDPALLSPIVKQICPACLQPMEDDDDEHQTKNVQLTKINLTSNSFISNPNDNKRESMKPIIVEMKSKMKNDGKEKEIMHVIDNPLVKQNGKQNQKQLEEEGKLNYRNNHKPNQSTML